MLPNLIPDLPIDTPDSDYLGYAVWAETVADMIQSVRGPLVIGVLGPWGSGKTSILQLTRRRLDDAEMTVWFNAWQYDHEEWPLIPLVCSMLEAVEKRPSGTENLARALRAILAGFSAKVEYDVPMLNKLAVGFDGKKAIERYDALSKQWVDLQLENTQSLQALRRLDKEVDQDTRLVVFIDDLDRCTPGRALRLLEQIRLVLNHPCIRFVVALAPRVLEAQLEKRYSDWVALESRTYASNYLEKIIQVPLWISRRENLFSEKLGQELVKKTRFGFLFAGWPIDTWQKLGSVMEHNPRRLIRLLNQYLVWAQQDFSAYSALLTPWTVSERLRTEYRHVYDGLINNPGLCEVLCRSRSGDATRSSLKEILLGMIGDDKVRLNRDAVDHLLTAVEREETLHYLLASEPGQIWLKEGDLRECLNEIAELDAYHCDLCEKASQSLLFADAGSEAEMIGACQDISAAYSLCPRFIGRLSKVLTTALNKTSRHVVCEEINGLLKKLQVFENELVQTYNQ